MDEFVSPSPTVLEIERSIYTLSFSEKLWLVERIAQQLRSKIHAFEPSIRESQLADMANDPEIQAELNAINAEFLVTEMEGRSRREWQRINSGCSG